MERFNSMVLAEHFAATFKSCAAKQVSVLEVANLKLPIFPSFAHHWWRYWNALLEPAKHFSPKLLPQTKITVNLTTVDHPICRLWWGKVYNTSKASEFLNFFDFLFSFHRARFLEINANCWVIFICGVRKLWQDFGPFVMLCSCQNPWLYLNQACLQSLILDVLSGP